jgi:hypothetical protein
LPVVVASAVIDFWPPAFQKLSVWHCKVGVDVDRPNLLAMGSRTNVTTGLVLYLAAAFFICLQEIT